MVGDHDIRSEDRQLLLDALLAAGESPCGDVHRAHERTNASRPTMLPIGELSTSSTPQRVPIPFRPAATL